MTAGLDLSLALVAKWWGVEITEKIAANLEWQRSTAEEGTSVKAADDKATPRIFDLSAD